MTEYNVMREHYGDKYYQTGDKRTANAADVKHLVDKGVLTELKEEKKPVKTSKQVKSE